MSYITNLIHTEKINWLLAGCCMKRGSQQTQFYIVVYSACWTIMILLDDGILKNEHSAWA